MFIMDLWIRVCFWVKNKFKKYVGAGVVVSFSCDMHVTLCVLRNSC